MSYRYRIYELLAVFIFVALTGIVHSEQANKEDKIEELIKILDTRHWDSAVDELVQIGEPAVKPLLLELRRQTRLTSARSCYALTRIGTSEAVEAVMKVLKNTDSPAMIREYAAHSLGDTKSDAAFLLLCATLESDFATGVRMYAARALGKIGSEKAVAALVHALGDSSPYVRGIAAENVGKFKSRRSIPGLIELLKDNSDFARSRARFALVEAGEQAIDPLLGQLAEKESLVRWMAVWILGKIGSELAINGLLGALEDPDWRVRDEAAVALAGIDSVDSVPFLIDLLNDEKITVREEAAWILGKIKDRSAVNPLLLALADEDSGWMAAAALGEIQAEEGLERLTSALLSEDVRLRRAAAWSLEKIPSPRTVSSLIEVLDDQDWEVRMWAIFALETIGTPEALMAVKKKLGKYY